MAAPQQHAPLVWIDIGASDRDVNRAEIVSIATIVTDEALNVLGEGPELRIGDAVSLADAETETLAFLEQHTSAEQSPLCGRSVWEKRLLLARQMRTLHPFLHYRAIDVDSIQQLSQRWYPHIDDPVADGTSLRSHIHATIEALRFYRAKVFR